MASANTLCKKILNVKGMVVESTEFYEGLFGVQHLDLQAMSLSLVCTKLFTFRL